MDTAVQHLRWFDQIGLDDVPHVGGKNASLGEMVRTLAPLGVRVPNGFAITAEAYRDVLASCGAERHLREALDGLVVENVVSCCPAKLAVGRSSAVAELRTATVTSLPYCCCSCR